MPEFRQPISLRKGSSALNTMSVISINLAINMRAEIRLLGRRDGGCGLWHLVFLHKLPRIFRHWPHSLVLFLGFHQLMVAEINLHPSPLNFVAVLANRFCFLSEENSSRHLSYKVHIISVSAGCMIPGDPIKNPLCLLLLLFLLKRHHLSV